MSDYKRRNVNIDKLSSHIRKTGECAEETALRLMDEIMFLRADISGIGSKLTGLNAAELVTIADIRNALGCGSKPMLFELPGICREMRGRMKELEAERDDLQQVLGSERQRVERLEYEKSRWLEYSETEMETRTQAARDVCDFIMSGSFLHDTSPPKMFAKEVTAAIKAHFGINGESKPEPAKEYVNSLLAKIEHLEERLKRSGIYEICDSEAHRYAAKECIKIVNDEAWGTIFTRANVVTTILKHFGIKEGE